LKAERHAVWEGTLLTSTGTRIPVEIRDYLFEMAGAPAILSTVRDISMRKKLEESLEREKTLLSTLIDNLPDYVSVKDTKSRILIANSANTRMMGHRTPRDVVGRTDADFFPLEESARYRADELSVIQTGSPIINAEEQSLDPEGRRRWTLTTKVPLKDAHGAVIGVVCTGRDITQIREAGEQLAESETRFRSIVESSPMGIHSYSLEDGGRLLLTGGNPAADRMLGIDHGALVGKTIEEAFPALASTEVPSRYREAAEHGRTWKTSQIEYKDDRVSGAYEVYAFRTSPNRMAAMFLDITSRMRDEEERRKLEGKLAQAQKLESIGRLAGGVAHDFNNCLTAIIGSVSLAQIDVSPNDPMSGPLADIQRAAQSAAGLTKQLLAFSRQQLAEPRVLNLNDVIQRVVQMLHRLIGENVELRLLPDQHLGNVRIDPGQLEQVLVNLALNARDSMPNGGHLTIETANAQLDAKYCARHAGTQPGSYVVLVVSDSGTGMTEEVKAQIFEPFFSTKAKGKGTGLGLATVFGIVTQNGGSIEVYTELGVGSTFKVYLPRVNVKAESLLPAERKEMPSGTETVFLVEDEEMLRKLGERILRRLGYHVFPFPSGDDALQALRAAAVPVDLLITDVILPGMNGRLLAEKARAERPGLKVLFCSGYTENVIAHHGILEEGIEFIGKPYSPFDLAQKIRAVLDRVR
jgi:PAS domain S-box-containing protein